ncbi:MAG: hypothetical protein CVU44_12905 [Chloroflexi bacterium HGW-Chloroflexi-6]|nr:MAG: hypothetical protein CVU44_12905 [Chloroflexi bacterium HGW-Chloroflexi-6]
MQEFLSSPWVLTIGWILGAIGWVVGIVSGILQVKSYQDQKKFEHGHNAILEQAERDWEGKFTQEQIDSMKQEVLRLEEIISRDIPRKARQVFLEDQLAKVKEDLAQNYLQYEEINSKLSNEGTKLPDQIQHSIEKSIMPSYIANKREGKRLQWLIGLAIFLIIIVNWSFVAALIPLDWSLDSRYSDYRYPASWFVIYFILAIIISIMINQFFVGVWIGKLAQNLRSSLNSKDDGKSWVQKIKIQLKVGANIIFLLGLGFILFVSPIVYWLFTEGRATYWGPAPMPLSSLPQATLCAVPPAIILLIFYYFIKASRKMTLEPSMDKADRQVSTIIEEDVDTEKADKE